MQGISRKIAFVLAIIVTSSIAIVEFNHKSNIKISQPKDQMGEIRIVQEKNPLLAQIRHGLPIPQKGPEYIKWLQGSFQIRASGGSGSGTLCYYDYKTKTGYVISCGHLWSGIFHRSMGQTQNATITTWYHNKKKLTQPKSYQAEVIFYDNAYDVSLLIFRPDWIPEIYFPIAKTQKLTKGDRLHSLGCDHGQEVADYIVEVIGLGADPRGGGSLTTEYNSPRPGRSGGGLIDKWGYFIGICWGTTRSDGTGLGYFVPLSSIQQALKKYGYESLVGMSLPGLARNLSIKDHNKPNKFYPKDFILMPER